MEKVNKSGKSKAKISRKAKPGGLSFKSDPETSKLIKTGRVATRNAIRASRALGLPITFMQDGKLYKEFPDGKKELIICTSAKKTTAKKTTIPLRKGMIFHAKK
jgi:hypothetical protein